MAAFQKFPVFLEDLHAGLHDLRENQHDVKVLLTNTTPTAGNTRLSDLTEITAENGYSAGGLSIDQDVVRTGGVTQLTGVDQTFTASGGSIGPFRYVVVYNSTATGGPLIAWWDRGSSLTLEDNESFQVQFDGGVVHDME